jgi:hypothetical protein
VGSFPAAPLNVSPRYRQIVPRCPRRTALKAISNPTHPSTKKVYRRNHLQSVNFMVILFMSRSPRDQKQIPLGGATPDRKPSACRQHCGVAWLGRKEARIEGEARNDGTERRTAQPGLHHRRRPSPQAPACGILSGASGNKSKRRRVHQNAGPARQVLW